MLETFLLKALIRFTPLPPTLSPKKPFIKVTKSRYVNKPSKDTSYRSDLYASLELHDIPSLLKVIPCTVKRDCTYWIHERCQYSISFKASSLFFMLYLKTFLVKLQFCFMYEYKRIVASLNKDGLWSSFAYQNDTHRVIYIFLLDINLLFIALTIAILQPEPS